MYEVDGERDKLTGSVPCGSICLRHPGTQHYPILSTHSIFFLQTVSRQYADVAIHCGDLTTESQIDEYKASIRFSRAVYSPLELVIAGNHDLTMDTPIFQRKAAEAQPLS
ncbi:hypothetical protein ACN38_g12434 [Penicillium nordicum]|uniref:Calcineurin-like phosphoesterase domain-containing protein n=1 Tax=Penicillium nordicum TaxID=229535 RepID=A0A0M9WA23_9EURO|nr:hypothetical protein ACN38_g12434 [Penicillium nordicum]